jgi:hypothetical protein
MRWLQDRSSKNWVCDDSPVFIGGKDVTRASDPGDRAELERLRGHVNINIQPRPKRQPASTANRPKSLGR